MRIIKTSRLILKDVDEDEIPILHAWRNSDTFRRFCSTRRNVVSLEDFKQEYVRDLESDRYLQLMIIKKSSHEPIGTVWAYNINLTDGYVFITTFLEPNYHKIGYGIESFVGTIIYLFDTLPTLHKIYTEAYSYNHHSVSIMQKAGFLEEGIFLEHRLIDEKRYDLHRFAFYRRQLSENVNLIKKIKPISFSLGLDSIS
jgi:RimJ/RimL family protein N-acetyltransferase